MKKLKVLLTSTLAAVLVCAFAATASAADPAITGVDVSHGNTTIGSVSTNGGSLIVPNATLSLDVSLSQGDAGDYHYAIKTGSAWQEVSNPSDIDVTVNGNKYVEFKIYTLSVTNEEKVINSWRFNLNGKSIDTTISPIMYKNFIATSNRLDWYLGNNTFSVTIPDNTSGVYVEPGLKSVQTVDWTSGWQNGTQAGNWMANIDDLRAGQSTSSVLAVSSEFANAVDVPALKTAYTTQYTFKATKTNTQADTTLSDLSLATKSGGKSLFTYRDSKTSFSADISSSTKTLYLSFEADRDCDVYVKLNTGKEERYSYSESDIKLTGLKSSSNTIYVRVEDKNNANNKTNYTIKVSRDSESGDNTLEDLKLTNASNDKTIKLSPTFKTSTYSYTASVDTAVKKVNIEFDPSDSDAEIKLYLEGKLKDTFDGGDDYDVTLKDGKNTIRLDVKPSDGGTAKKYTVVITRGSADATLSGISLRDGNNNTISFSPNFSSGTSTYTATVANNVTSIAIKANTSDSDSTLKINNTSVSSGSWSKDIQLSVGTNSIPVTVTATDGTTKTYTMKVTRSSSGSTTGSKVIKVTFGSTTATVNNSSVVMDTAPFLYKYGGVNYTMVPIRFIGEQGLGAKVDWNANTKQIVITQNGKVVSMTLGKANASAGLDCPPIAKNNRTFVPLRYVAQTLGCTVDYTSVNAPIVITCPQ